MADLNHPVVTGTGLTTMAMRALSTVGGGVVNLGRTAAQVAAAEAAITAVDSLMGSDNQGVVGFDFQPERDSSRVTDPTQMTTQDLANSLRIEERPNIIDVSPEIAISFAERDSDGTAVANELISRMLSDESEISIVSDTLESKATLTESNDDSIARQMPDNILEMMVNPDLSTPIRTSALSTANTQRIPNRTLDGRRVSREYGEYQYCRTSGQIDSALNFLALWDAGQLVDVDSFLNPFAGSLLLEVGGFAGDQLSYGQFVDMVCLRRFIALRRNLLRKVRAANVREILALTQPPTDPELLARKILAGVDHTQVIEEINRTFNNRVGPNTNQEACTANGGATGAIEDRREAMQDFTSGGQGAS